MYGTCRGKMICLKKEIIDLEMTEQEVRVFHKRYFSFLVNNHDFIEPEQTKKQMVCH